MQKALAKPIPPAVETANLTESVRLADFALADMEAAWSQVQQIQKLKNEASFRGLRAGCALVAIKLLLDHGQFIPFCEEHFPTISQRHCQRYMQLAEKFLEAHAIQAADAFQQMIGIDASSVVGFAEQAKALPAGKGEAKHAVIEGGMPQLVFGFIGGDSLTDLLRRYGIVQPPTGKPRKALPAAKPLTHADKVATYTEAWRKVALDLNEQGMRQKTWAVLDHTTLANVARVLEDLARLMRDDIAKEAARAGKRRK